MPVGFGNSDLMQFYLRLWMDTGLTLRGIGRWEEENMFECESYIVAYVRRLQDEAKRLKQSR